MKQRTMDYSKVELPDRNQILLPDTKSVDSFLDEFLKSNMATTTTCTHTHTCNPLGPDKTAHTHMCLHTHTQVLVPEQEDNRSNKKSFDSRPKKRQSGNREAVRKYREKKKAHTAYLEEEVKKLRILNQQMARKLQVQAVLEAEISRLRNLLVEISGKIDTELNSFVFEQRFCNGNSMRCESSFDGNGRMKMVSWEARNCQEPIVDCRANYTGGVPAPDTVESLVSSASQAD